MVEESNSSLWDTVKTISPIISTFLNALFILVVYIWNNRNKDDDKFKVFVESIPGKIKEDLKEWMDLKEIFVRASVESHTKDIEALFNKVTAVDKENSNLKGRLDSCEKRCEILRKMGCREGE